MMALNPAVPSPTLVPSATGPRIVASASTLSVEYHCPCCGAALVARSSQTFGWLRCPRCGRAGLPPEPVLAPPVRTDKPPGDDVPLIGADPDHHPTGPWAAGRSRLRRIAA